MRRERALDVATLLFAIAIAFLLRTVPVYDQVFRDGRVVFGGNDAWIHMRNADVAAANLSAGWFDSYRLAPGGQWTEAPLMDWIIAGVATLSSGGAAPASAIDRAGAWIPPIAGSLIVIPVFLLTLRLFGRRAARLAAFLLAVLPGQLLQRSLLGQADHHVFEALLAAVVLLLLLPAIDADERRSGVGWSVSAGIALGLYLLAWSSGAFLVLILLGAGLAVLVFAEVGVRSPGRAVRPFVIALLVAAIVALQSIMRLPAMRIDLPLLVGGAVMLSAVAMLAGRLRRSTVSTGSGMLAACATIAVLVVIMALIPAVRREVAGYVVRLTPSPETATVGEARPLLTMTGRFSLRPVWAELSTSAVFLLIGLAMLARKAFRQRSASHLLFLFWSIATVVATLMQARFGYYLAITAAVVASEAAVRATAMLDRRFAGFVLVAVVLYPSVWMAIGSAEVPGPDVNRSWFEVLDWMRTNTPDPFAAGAYLEAPESEASAPRAQYSVMNWWDSGYWVTRIAHRPPASNPTQAGAREAAQFYLNGDESSALRILAAKRSRYVLVDGSMPVHMLSAGKPGGSQLDPMTRWAHIERRHLFELCFRRDASSGARQGFFVYYPDYYRTMAMRLLATRGGAWTPERSTWAIAIRDVKAGAGTFRELVDWRQFDTYEAAERFVASDPGRWKIAGLDPMRSCVPLPALQHFRPVMESQQEGLVRLYEVH